jgi:peptide/nickel transport system permease protein
MKQYIIRRAGYSLLSLFLLSLTIFLFVRVTGDPIALLTEPGASADDIEAMRHQFGLDQPLWVQYWHFVASFLTGDLGQSFYYRTPVLELYFQRLPNSLLLAAVAMGLSLLIGIPSGILAAVRVDRFWDSAGKIFALLGLSLPAVLGRPGADPGVLGVPRLAALLRLRHLPPPADAGRSPWAGTSPPRTCA